MDTSEFRQYIGGTAECMEIIIKGSKGCGQMLSNKNNFSGIWFSGVKTSEEDISEGVDYTRGFS